MHVFSRLFGADGKLNTCVVPGHCDAVLRVFDIAPGRARKSTDHTFRSRAEFVKVLQTLRRRARGVVLETPERERKLAELHAQSLAAGGPWRLMPGARPWLLELVDLSNAAVCEERRSSGITHESNLRAVRRQRRARLLAA